MSEEEILFLETYKDIEKRVNEKNPYEILQISALVRKLFFDDFPLVDQVNRSYKEKLVFEITKTQPYYPGSPAPTYFSAQDGLDPATARPGKQILQVKRDEFFRTPILLVNGKECSIRETILFEANIMGGVHAGLARTDNEKALKQLDNLSVGGYRTSLRQLKAIARVILKALKPLKERIQ